MDRAFIENNQILERYLAGKLPFKGAQDFEQYCRAHPEVLEELKFGERVNAALRLLEAGGRPLDWQEPKPVWWRRWETLAAVAAACVGLAVWVAVLSGKHADRKKEIAALQQSLREGPIQAPTDAQTLRIMPGRSGPGSASVANVRLKNPPDLLELRIDLSYTKHTLFRVTLDKKDNTRIGTAYNLMRDSNGEVRLAINTSVLQAGEYKVSILGMPFRGNPVPVGWMTLRAR